MLEEYFNHEKIFSIIQYALKSDNEEVNILRFCFDSGISPEETFVIVQKLISLKILIPTKKDEFFILNLDSEILLFLCLFDDAVCRFLYEEYVQKVEEDEPEFLRDLKGFLSEDLSKYIGHNYKL